MKCKLAQFKARDLLDLQAFQMGTFMPKLSKNSVSIALMSVIEMIRFVDKHVEFEIDL